MPAASGTVLRVVRRFAVRTGDGLGGVEVLNIGATERPWYFRADAFPRNPEKSPITERGGLTMIALVTRRSRQLGNPALPS
jgi:hypothetical protein